MHYDDIDYNKIEKHCCGLVKFFNEVGIKTFESCEGHKDTRKHKVWVSFDTDEDTIINFIGSLKFYRDRMDENGRDNSIRHRLYGHFAKVYPFFTFETENKMMYAKHDSAYIPRWYYICDVSTDYKRNRQAAAKDLQFFRRCLEEKSSQR